MQTNLAVVQCLSNALGLSCGRNNVRLSTLVDVVAGVAEQGQSAALLDENGLNVVAVAEGQLGVADGDDNLLVAAVAVVVEDGTSIWKETEF